VNNRAALLESREADDLLLVRSQLSLPLIPHPHFGWWRVILHRGSACGARGDE
jgi:hypothetical protein